MKILKITPIKDAFYVDTDEEEQRYYRRFGPKSWEVTMGESSETVYDYEEIEALFQAERFSSEEPLTFNYDPARDILMVDGMQYSGAFFRALNKGGIPLNTPFKVIERSETVITIERLK